MTALTATARRTPALVVLCFVQFMLVLDDSVVGVALPTIKDELGFGTSGLAWVTNAYFLAFGGLLILFGRVADLWGRRRAFVTGVILFGVASLVCGLAREPWQLVTGRFVQGAGSALASPAALSLLTLLYPRDRERARAIGIWGGIAALGAISGLVVSGVLTGLSDWRWIFLINLPVAVVAVALVPRLVPESRADQRTRLDVPGAVVGTGALVSLVYGLLRAGESGWTDGLVLAALGTAVVLAVGFAILESRTAVPLVPLSFLTHRVRAVANLLTLVFSAAMYAMAFLLMIHLQTVLGYEPLVAGIAYLPYGAAILTGMWLSARSVNRLGRRRALMLSLLITASGLALLSGIDAADDYLLGVLPGLLVTAFGCGLSLPALSLAAVSGTTGDNAGVGAAIFASVQQIGAAVGVSMLVTVAASGTETEAVAAESGGYRLALLVAATMVALAGLVIPDLRDRAAATSSPRSRGR